MLNEFVKLLFLLQTTGSRETRVLTNQIKLNTVTLSPRDKVSQRLTANTAMTDSVVSAQAIKMLILESSTVEMTQDERWKFPRLFLSLMRLGDNYCFFLFPPFPPNSRMCQAQVQEFSKVTSSQNVAF